MVKRSWLMRLAAFMVVLTMLLGTVGIVYSEELEVTEPVEEQPAEVTEAVPEPVAEPEPEPVAEPEPEPVAEPEPEPVPEPEPEPEPAPEPEPEPVEEPVWTPEEEPAPEPAEEPEPEPETVPEPQNTVVTELSNQEGQIAEETADEADEDEDDEDEDWDEEDEYFEFEEDDAGAVSDNLLEMFNNPETFEQVEFAGSADIELENENELWNSDWDGKVTLTANVRNTNLSYRLVWEANDHDDRGWFTVGSGDKYSYTITPSNLEREASREYRVVMFTVD